MIIMGWISSIRDHGNLHFIMVRDRIGETQVVAKKGECPDLVFSQIRYLKEHTSLAIKGRIKYQSKSPSGVEVVPLEIRVFSLVTTAAPFMIQGNRSSIGIDTRLDLRAVDLRRKILQSIFRIRYTSLNSVREFLAKEGFLEVNTPKMIATATEGGAASLPDFLLRQRSLFGPEPSIVQRTAYNVLRKRI